MVDFGIAMELHIPLVRVKKVLWTHTSNNVT